MKKKISIMLIVIAMLISLFASTALAEKEAVFTLVDSFLTDFIYTSRGIESLSLRDDYFVANVKNSDYDYYLKKANYIESKTDNYKIVYSNVDVKNKIQKLTIEGDVAIVTVNSMFTYTDNYSSDAHESLIGDIYTFTLILENDEWKIQKVSSNTDEFDSYFYNTTIDWDELEKEITSPIQIGETSSEELESRKR